MSDSAYAEKLKDPRWQKKRLEIFDRDDWACRFCGHTDKPLNAHHRIYNDALYPEPWDYPGYLLITACDDCHERIGNIPTICGTCFQLSRFHCCSCRDAGDIILANCPDWWPILN